MSQATQVKKVQLESVPSVEIDYMALDDIIENKFNNDKENLIMILGYSTKLQFFTPTGPRLSFYQARCTVQPDLWCCNILQHFQS